MYVFVIYVLHGLLAIDWKAFLFIYVHFYLFVTYLNKCKRESDLFASQNYFYNSASQLLWNPSWFIEM